MPIIIDNFHVNTNVPIDNRFVVGGTDSFYSNRDAIQYKYQGLRIWDLTPNNSGPYYWTGVTWSSENAVGVSVDGTTLPGYLPVFTQGPTVLGKSIIFENPASNQIGIGLVGNSISANVPSGPSLVNGLHVAGNIRTNASFVGSGLHVTDINASNINSGLLAVTRISHLSISGLAPGLEYVLFNEGTSNSVRWRAASGLSVLNSTNTTNVNISENSSSTVHYITFVNAISGQLPLRINSSKMQFRPDNGQLFLSDGSANEPTYTFLSSVSGGVGKSGIYHSNSNGVSTSVQGNEITSVRTYGLVTNNRIYIPTASNNTDVGYGIVWSTNGNSTNNISTNDGFVYNGKRLNFYGIGSHIPTGVAGVDISIPNSPYTFGTYIAGYFGVDIFSGGRLKVKVSELNDVTINSRLNINLTDTNFDTLASSTNVSLVLSTMANRGGSAGNIVVIKDWSVRSAQVPNTPAQDSWLTWKHHNGITIDGYYNTPNGPAKIITDPDSPAYGTLTFWERHPFLHEQYFGSENRKTLTINSTNPTTQNPFVKVDGNLLVGSSTTPITNSTGNIVVGNGNLLVGTNTIVPSAIVDFTSTTKGFLPPRMTTTQRNAIVSPVTGLTIYNTDTGWVQTNQSNTHRNALNTYDGSKWVGVTTFLYRGRTAIFNPGTDDLYRVWFTTNGPVLATARPTNSIQVGLNYLVVGSLEVVGLNDTYDNYNRDNDVLFTIGRKDIDSFELVLRELGPSTQNLRFSFYLLPL
jgi:hypothetical protein